MGTIRERYLVDEDGKRMGVVLDLEEYSQLLEQAEELDAIQAYDAAKAEDDEVIPFDQANSERRASSFTLHPSLFFPWLLSPVS